MLFNKLVFKKATPCLIIGLAVLSLSITSCSTGPSKKEIAAKEAQIKKAEVEKARKIAAKKEAQKRAVEQEDAMEVQSAKVVTPLPKAEKLLVVPVTSPGPATPALEIPTEPDTYLITIGQKDKTHPFYGVGDERGFSVNGVQGNYIIARRNHPVTFRVRTSAMHDFYISTSEKGWGAAAYRAGVSGQFTYKGDVSLTPNLNTPDVLYYACRNHNSMGGKIVIVDENADLAAVAKKAEAERVAQLAKFENLAVKSVDPKKVKQKIAYVGMLMQFKGKTLPAPQLKMIEEKLDTAKSLEKQGDLAGSLAIAEEAAALFKKKAEVIGPSKEEIAEQKEGYNDLMITLEAFVDSHLASYKQAKEEGRKTVSYDSDAVEALLLDADKLAKQEKYEEAGKSVQKASRLVTKALNLMLNEQTITYDLNFKTPADEFAYEVTRYKGYEELIPVAIEVKKPDPAKIKYSKTFTDKAEFFRGKAVEAAEAERWEEALVVIKDATIEMRRGLRILGVSM